MKKLIIVSNLSIILFGCASTITEQCIQEGHSPNAPGGAFSDCIVRRHNADQTSTSKTIVLNNQKQNSNKLSESEREQIISQISWYYLGSMPDETSLYMEPKTMFSVGNVAFAIIKAENPKVKLAPLTFGLFFNCSNTMIKMKDQPWIENKNPILLNARNIACMSGFRNYE